MALVGSEGLGERGGGREGGKRERERREREFSYIFDYMMCVSLRCASVLMSSSRCLMVLFCLI